MLKIKSWRIYYADGSAFTSDDGSWAQAPPFGVQCVVYYDLEGRAQLDGGEHDGHIYRYQGDGFRDDVKMGLWIDNEGAKRIYDLARLSAWPD